MKLILVLGQKRRILSMAMMLAKLLKYMIQWIDLEENSEINND
jgi:hypothetical protein